MITLPFLRQIMETGLEAVKAQSKRAGLPNATVTLEGRVVNTGVGRKKEGVIGTQQECTMTSLLLQDLGMRLGLLYVDSHALNNDVCTVGYFLKY